MSGQTESPSKLMQKLIESGYPIPEGGFIGCSDSDIAALESHFSVRLPEAYKEFLRVCGRDAGQFLSYCLYQAQALIDWVPSILAGPPYVQFKLPPGNFVFIEDNELVLYFDTKAGDDPPVWRYDYAENKIDKVFDSFSFWLGDVISHLCATEKSI